MFRVTPILGHLKNLGKRPLQNDINFLHMSQDTPTGSNKNLYKMSLWKNLYSISRSTIQECLYKMTEPKPIFWAKTCPAQNDGLCRARALPFCAGNFKGDKLGYIDTLGNHQPTRLDTGSPQGATSSTTGSARSASTPSSAAAVLTVKSTHIVWAGMGCMMGTE